MIFLGQWSVQTRLNDFLKDPFWRDIFFIFMDPWLSIFLTVIWSFDLLHIFTFDWWFNGLVRGLIILVTMGIVSFLFLFLPVPISSDYDDFCISHGHCWFLPFTIIQRFFLFRGCWWSPLHWFHDAALSLQGLKNATAAAVVTPMIILMSPITDAF